MPRLKIRENGQWSSIGKDEVYVPLKACVCFDLNSNILGESLNITSIQKLDTGHWQQNFETPPPDGHYCAHITSDYSNYTGRNDVAQTIKNSYDVVNGKGDYTQTFTTVYNDSKQNCPTMSLRVYW